MVGFGGCVCLLLIDKCLGFLVCLRCLLGRFVVVGRFAAVGVMELLLCA